MPESGWVCSGLSTIEGKHLHERADNPFIKDSSCGLVVWRSVNLISYRLGFSGRADIVEFKRNPNGIEIAGKTGRWIPYPVEYKRGKPKPDERDEVQLCAQAVCMEEMFGIDITEGAIFYGETRHRTIVHFSNELRNLVDDYSREMHRLFKLAITPPPVFKPHCKSCSMVDICLPKQLSSLKSASNYLKTELR